MGPLQAFIALTEASEGVPPGHWSNPSVIVGSLVVWLMAFFWVWKRPRLPWVPFILVLLISILQEAGFLGLIAVISALLSFVFVGKVVSKVADLPKTIDAYLVTGFVGWSGMATAASFLQILPPFCWLIASLSVGYFIWQIVVRARWRQYAQFLGSQWANQHVPVEEGLYHRLISLAAASVAAVVYGAYGGLLGRVPELGDAYWMHSQLLNNISTWGGLFSRLPVQPVFNFFPLGGNAAVAMPFVLANFVGVKTCLLCVVVAAARFIARLFSRSILNVEAQRAACWLAILATASNASIYMSITQLYQEAALFIAVTMLILLTARMYRDNSCVPAHQYLIVGSLAGLVAGMKLFMVPYLIIWTSSVVFSIAIIHAIKSKSMGMFVIRILALFAGLVLGSGAFYARSFALTGNPVFPFYNSIFKSPYFDLFDFKDNRWNQPFNTDWLLRSALGDYGDYVEASWGFVPVAATFFALAGIAYLAYRALTVLFGTPGKFNRNSVEWLTYIAMLVIPSLLILQQMNYSRYVTQSILPIYIAGIVAFLAVSPIVSALAYRLILSFLASAILIQIPFMDAAMYTASRYPSNWKIGAVGVPTSKSKEHVLDADRDVSQAINRDFKAFGRQKKAAVFYLIGDGDALIDGTKIPIGPFPGGGLNTSKLMPIHSVWYFQLVNCLHDYDDNPAVAAQAASVIGSFLPAYVVIENSDLKKPGFQYLRNRFGLSLVHKNNSVSVFRAESRLQVSRSEDVSLTPACKNALVSAKTGYRF